MGIACSVVAPQATSFFCSPETQDKDNLALPLDGLVAARDDAKTRDGCCAGEAGKAVEITEADRLRNPEVLTPKAPPQMPYAVAGGPDVAQTPIHGSLEPRSQGSSHRRPPHPAPPCNRQPMQGTAAAAMADAASGFQRSPSFGEPGGLISSSSKSPQTSGSQIAKEGFCPPRLCAFAASYRERLQHFLERAQCGLRCRVVLTTSAQPQLATCMCHLPTGSLRIVPIASDTSQVVTIRVIGICNIWVGGSGAGSIQGTSNGELLQFDTCDGSFGLMLEEEAGKKWEDILLDCLAVLICLSRERSRRRGDRPPNDSQSGAPRKELVEAWQAQVETPTDGSLDALRPCGTSLMAKHLLGPAAALLVVVGQTVVPDAQLV